MTVIAEMLDKRHTNPLNLYVTVFTCVRILDAATDPYVVGDMSSSPGNISPGIPRLRTACCARLIIDCTPQAHPTIFPHRLPGCQTRSSCLLIALLDVLHKSVGHILNHVLILRSSTYAWDGDVGPPVCATGLCKLHLAWWLRRTYMV